MEPAFQTQYATPAYAAGSVATRVGALPTGYSNPPLSTSYPLQTAPSNPALGLMAPMQFNFGGKFNANGQPRDLSMGPNEYGAPPPLGQALSQSMAANNRTLDEADRLGRQAAEYQDRVKQLEAQPNTNENLGNQIQELLKGQEALRYEIDQVKMQVSSNMSTMEAMQRDAAGRPMQPEPYYQSQSAPAQAFSTVPAGRGLEPPPPETEPEKDDSVPHAYLGNLGYGGPDIDLGHISARAQHHLSTVTGRGGSSSGNHKKFCCF